MCSEKLASDPSPLLYVKIQNPYKFLLVSYWKVNYCFLSAPPIQQPVPPRFPGGLITKTANPGFEMIPVPGIPGGGSGLIGNPFQQMLGGINPMSAYPGINLNTASLLQQSKMTPCT